MTKAVTPKAKTGADYVATVRLSAVDNRTLAEPGETCAKVHSDSLWWLAEQGLIVPKSKE